MFNGFKNFIRKVGNFMGIIKEINSKQNIKNVNIPDDYYEKIRIWAQLHKGKEKGIHEIECYSIGEGHHKRELATLNMPKVISQEMANLIFNERCKIEVSSNDAFKELIDEIFEREGFNGNFQQKLEFMFAQGGLVLKPYLENNKISISYSNAETFLPISWDNKKITEAVFPSYIHKNGKNYILLEWHVFNSEGRYTIKTELYESKDGETVGKKVNLSIIYPNTIEEIIFSESVKEPLFSYFKPNTANNIDSNLPLGISLYGNSYDTLKTIDTIYDSFLHEFQTGKKKIMIDSKAVRKQFRTDGKSETYFDLKDTAFQAFDLSNNSNETFFKEVEQKLRVTEHVEGLNASLDTLSLQIGFSPGTFSFSSSGGLKTATEVISENSKTFRTKKGHENSIEQSIQYFINVIAIFADELGIINKPETITVNVAFDDSIIQDKTSIIDDQIKKISAGIQSKAGAIEVIEGLGKIEALEKLLEIMKEQRAELPDLDDLRNMVALNGPIE